MIPPVQTSLYVCMHACMHVCMYTVVTVCMYMVVIDSKQCLSQGDIQWLRSSLQTSFDTSMGIKQSSSLTLAMYVCMYV